MEVAFVLRHNSCRVAGCFKQSGAAPEQIGMLWVGKSGGGKGAFFSWALKLLLYAFSFLL